MNQMFSDGAFTRPPNETAPPETPPVSAPPPGETPPVSAPPPAAGLEPRRTPSAFAEGLEPSLRQLLIQQRSGYNLLSDEQLQTWGGAQILDNVRQFDPNANWTYVPGGSNEGGDIAGGWRLDFDPSAIPAAGAGTNHPELNFVPIDENTRLTNGAMVYDDPYYGRVTPYHNVQKERDPWWVTAAPIAVSLVAPWAAGVAAGAGIGTAGLASTVTSGAYAGGAAGASGATQLAAGGGDWWTRLIGKAPQVGRAIDGAVSAPKPVAPAPRPPAPAVTTAPKAQSSGYNPANFNNMGTAAKPSTSNESSLVATQFADDPYGNSY